MGLFFCNQVYEPKLKIAQIFESKSRQRLEKTSIQSKKKILKLQLNEYETNQYFLQLSQNMATNCWFTFVFFPVLI